jgi:type II secretory pathway pseudopilin PulG
LAPVGDIGSARSALEAGTAAADMHHVGIRLWRRLRSDNAFGLVELLIALLILNTAVLALVAAFVSSSTALRRAGRTATAATLADRQLELYRALTFSVIALDSTTVGSTDTTYRNDTALPSSSTTNLITTTSGCSGLPNECNPSRTVAGPDGESYRVDTYIVCVSNTSHALQTPSSCSSTSPNGTIKLVTVVVRDAGALAAAAWARQSSSFDRSTGG